jgi:hypothetical protein
MRKYPIVLVLVILSVIFIDCMAAAASPKQEEATYVANFNYTPDSQAAPGSAGITFAIGNSTYKYTDVKWITFPQFANLDKAIREDLVEILIAKGFSIRGPFDSYDLIPYQDKKAIDLYLFPTMELFVVFKPEKTSEYCTGNIEVKGKVTLELREIITRELMWVKSIPLKEFEFSYNIRVPDQTKPYDLKPFIMNDLAKGLEKQYPEFMSTISKLIDPEEMRILKKQCQEIRSKKGY